jgi:hypothetical protein
MRKIIVLILAVFPIVPCLAQETTTNTNPRNNMRQGFGNHGSYDLGLGFVNPNFQTDGSAYFFENWETNGMLYTKNNGNFKIEKVNINLYDNKLEALYDENSVFTFDSKNLLKIVINDRVFRVFEIEDKLKIYELIHSGSPSVYKYNNVLYSEAAVNPMLNRKKNKYIKQEDYYLYRDGVLTQIKLSKKAFSKLLESDTKSQKSILDYIKKAKLSLRNEKDLIKVLTFIGQ